MKNTRNILLSAIIVFIILALLILTTMVKNSEILQDNPHSLNEERSALQEALDSALADERKAEAVYSEILNTFGTVHPFANIRAAEIQHSDAILQLYTLYNLQVPTITLDNIPQFLSLQEACSAGVKAEEENIDLYNQLLKNIQQYPEAVKVFLRLQSASLQKHLPAFERCAN